MGLADVYEDYRSDARFDQLRLPGIVLVPGEGSSRPTALIVGEAPGAMENTHKRPFVGASGAVLRSLIIDVAGLEDRHYFITNVVKYRPPGNRTPTDQEIAASVPYLRREYSALGSPAVLIAVGGTALTALAPELKARVLKAAGAPIALRGGRALWAMVHPAYGLRNQAYRPKMEEHWEMLGNWMRDEGLA